MYHRYRGGAVALLALGMLLSALPVAAHQPPQSVGSPPALSLYWGPAVRRWEPVILEYAPQRGLDPDLVAAVVWTESLGRSRVYSAAGAVGLMQVMPKEAGFPWRPSAAQLEEPWCNVSWGTMALSIVIRQSHGDLYNALAAYNGGWEQVHLRGPRRYAADTLAHYVRAVAARHGLSPQGHWVATVAATDEQAREVLTVLGPQRPLARYSDRPVAARIPDAWTVGPPTALAFYPPDGDRLDSQIGVWILLDGQIVYPADPLPSLQVVRQAKDPAPAWPNRLY